MNISEELTLVWANIYDLQAAVAALGTRLTAAEAAVVDLDARKADKPVPPATP